MIDAATAQALLDAATPGPWTTDPDRPRFIDTGVMPQVDEADWGQPEQGLPWYHIDLQGERAWRYGDVRIMAAAPDLAATVVELSERIDKVIAILDEPFTPTKEITLGQHWAVTDLKRIRVAVTQGGEQ